MIRFLFIAIVPWDLGPGEASHLLRNTFASNQSTICLVKSTQGLVLSLLVFAHLFAGLS